MKNALFHITIIDTFQRPPVRGSLTRLGPNWRTFVCSHHWTLIPMNWAQFKLSICFIWRAPYIASASGNLLLANRSVTGVLTSLMGSRQTCHSAGIVFSGFQTILLKIIMHRAFLGHSKPRPQRNAACTQRQAAISPPPF